MFKKDKLGLGLLLGFLAPIFGLTIYYFFEFFPTFSVKSFFEALREQPSLITSIASLSMFVNVVLLTFFLNKRHDKTAIGVFVATLIYGIAALILKALL